MVVEFNETLSLVATLFPNPDGSYQEKMGKLVVRRPKSTMLGGVTYKGVAIIPLALHNFVNATDGQTLNNVPLTQSTEGPGKVDFVLTAKSMGEVDENDEAMSEMSGNSEHSVAAADFAVGRDEEDGDAVRNKFGADSSGSGNKTINGSTRKDSPNDPSSGGSFYPYLLISKFIHRLYL